jgi:2-C-methyl-D-erythritol 4-phosphate cytidylyltransferase
MKSCCAIIVAAGRGTRMGAKENKVFLPLSEKPVLVFCLDAFAACGKIDEIILVTRKADIPLCEALFEEHPIPKLKAIIPGGVTRQESVYQGLLHCDLPYAAIHDAARALITPEEISSVVESAKVYGAAALGVKSKDTLKQVGEDGWIVSTIDREHTYQIQTPQVFDTNLIVSAHKKARQDHFEGTDDCSLVERLSKSVKLVEGSYENLKLTTPEDILTAERILEKRRPQH